MKVFFATKASGAPQTASTSSGQNGHTDNPVAVLLGEELVLDHRFAGDYPGCDYGE